MNRAGLGDTRAMTSFARTARARAAVAALALSGLLGGCAQNAIMELQIELPPAPAGSSETFAYIQVATPAGGFDFDVEWGDTGFSFPLTATRQWACVSVVSGDPTVDVNARIRYCSDPECLDVADGNAPESRVAIESPLYIGRRTFVTVGVPQVPECALAADCGGFGACESGRCVCASDADCTATNTECRAGGCAEIVPRCKVEGCITGATDNYCADDGSHFCERLGAEPLSFECELGE
ncbi:MAG TPA: hypothetical protein DEF51_07410 [Myxococcales bacterium]|nr:hypothetical protein [Myxococcales bacterium]